MKLINKYIAKEFIPPFLYSICAFISIFVIVDLFDTLDETLKYNVSLPVLLQYYFYLIPSIFVNIIPISVLLATFYVIKNFNKHNEIIAMRMGGISLLGVIRPFILLGLSISLFVLVVDEILVPPTLYQSDYLRENKMRGKQHKADTKFKKVENLAFVGNDNRLYYVGTFDILKNSMHTILILEYDQKNELKKKIAADSAFFKDGKWLFKNVIIYEYHQDEAVSKKTMEEGFLNLSATPKILMRSKNQTAYMNSFQLKKLINKFSPEDRKIRNKLLVEFHYKLAFPFVSFMILLFSIPLALIRNRGGALISIGASIVIGLGFYIVLSISIAFGKGELLSPLLASWFANLLFGGVGIGLILGLHK